MPDTSGTLLRGAQMRILRGRTGSSFLPGTKTKLMRSATTAPIRITAVERPVNVCKLNFCPSFFLKNYFPAEHDRYSSSIREGGQGAKDEAIMIEFVQLLVLVLAVCHMVKPRSKTGTSSIVCQANSTWSQARNCVVISSFHTRRSMPVLPERSGKEFRWRSMLASFNSIRKGMSTVVRALEAKTIKSVV
ncbi:hypothetical protein BD410DRAFT_834376 [Rickenella mellea]|uniref:Uncharacterized protein n=1 Tax=Rickenella mellea TaxID=50990 RepID=A0A4R5XGD8_9AGAM|nr:hypothetical protein BD410DRAFT_834376 [Rickenella mellea]